MDVDNNPGVNHSYRTRGVNLAWEYERFDVSMGGKGTREYTPEQIQELLETSKVRGMDGQHINSASSYPELQGNPDNIKMLTRDEHFAEHGYDWRNQTSGELIDKDKMVTESHRKQVLKNDLQGLGISAAIGFSSGFVISAIMEIAKTGIYNVDFSQLLKTSFITGIETATISSVTYAGGRLVTSMIEKIGVDVTTNAGQAINIGTVGILSIAVISTYQYVKLIFNGVESGDAFEVVGKQLIVSLLSFAISALATGIWGNVVGLCVSIGTTVVYIGVNVAKSVHERKFNETLKEYTVEQHKPIFIG